MRKPWPTRSCSAGKKKIAQARLDNTCGSTAGSVLNTRDFSAQNGVSCSVSILLFKMYVKVMLTISIPKYATIFWGIERVNPFQPPKIVAYEDQN
jgi:hypothetical protein